jgi:hypothetical protein
VHIISPTRNLKSIAFWDITLCWNLTDVSEEYIAFIFRVEEKAEKDTNMKAGREQRVFLISPL